MTTTCSFSNSVKRFGANRAALGSLISLDENLYFRLRLFAVCWEADKARRALLDIDVHWSAVSLQTAGERNDFPVVRG